MRADSRIKQKMSSYDAEPIQIMLARLIDDVAFIAWTKTKDAEKNRNRPKSVLKSLLTKPEEAPEDTSLQTFSTLEEFHKARQKLIEGS